MFFLNVPYFAMWICECSHCLFVILLYMFAIMCCVLMNFSYCLLFLLILSTLVYYCFDLIAYCNPALIMTSSIFNPVSADNGSENLYVCNRLMT